MMGSPQVYGREISFGYSDDGSTGVFEVRSLNPQPVIKLLINPRGGVIPRINFRRGVSHLD